MKFLFCSFKFGFSNTLLVQHQKATGDKVAWNYASLNCSIDCNLHSIKKVWNQRTNSNAELKATLSNAQITPGFLISPKINDLFSLSHVT